MKSLKMMIQWFIYPVSQSLNPETPNATIHLRCFYLRATGIHRGRWGGVISGIFVSDFAENYMGLALPP
ncbi:MAG: hypothetical protein WBW71_15910, partial [Bacteroidota bacterium]